MTKDTVLDNIANYQGARARKEWTADPGLFPVEEEVIARHFPNPPARILDLGCGGGRTTLGLETRGYDVDAIDLSPDLVEEAQKRVSRARVRLMDARELDFPDASADAVLFSFNGLDCVHPERERDRVLYEVLRVLRPGGVFYYSGHNGVAAWLPRPGDNAGKLWRRDSALLRAQFRMFDERSRYLAYPEPDGTQVLYSALPGTHARTLERVGFELVAVYGSRSYRKGPHILDNARSDRSAWSIARLGRIAVSCPHLHYVAKKPTT